jgi:hypothetical protein
MKKLIILIFLISPTISFSQKRLDISIRFDKKIDVSKLYSNYHNGYRDIDFKDSIINNEIKIKDYYINEEVPFHITYKFNEKSTTTLWFFVNEKKSYVDVGFSKNELYLKEQKNIHQLDTTNKIYNDFMNGRKENSKQITELFNTFGGEVYSNDSIHTIFLTKFKNLNETTISILRKYPNDYISFWYFKNQIIDPSLNLYKKDTNYLNKVISEFKNIYSDKYLKTEEGQYYINSINVRLNPTFNNNTKSPDFKLNDITGVNQTISKYKGKYLLLDFWGSWCQPCMKSIPQLTELYNKLSKSEFSILGVSLDFKLNQLKSTIEKHNIKWKQIFDDNKTLLTLFKIYQYPTYILINKDGFIVLRTSDINEIKTYLNDRIKTNN